jgi:hypothetical protein
VALRLDAQCTSLHVSFDAPILVRRPVGLSIDGGPRQTFYTNRELTLLARAIDDGIEPGWGPPEFMSFYCEVAADYRDDVQAAGSELIARFAWIKEPRRIGVACSATARLLPALRAGHLLALDFHTEPRESGAAWYWPQLDARGASVPLDGLAAALDSLTRAP